MSSPILVQSTAGSITVYLELSADGLAATGLTFSDVVCDLKKEGESSFTNKTLDGTNFTEVGGGFYELGLLAADLDTLGNLYLRFTGATIRTSLISAFIAEAAPTTSNTISPPQTTIVFGYLFDAEGKPMDGASISARIISMPTILHPGDEGLAVGEGVVVAVSDAAGFFSIGLVTGTQVDVAIASANYRRTITVPTTSTNLFDLP